MLRISLAAGDNGRAVLLLEGRLTGPWVVELWKACEQVIAEKRALELDFSDVTFVDSGGVVLVKRLRSRGIAVAGCSPFVEEQLKSNWEYSKVDGG